MLPPTYKLPEIPTPPVTTIAPVVVLVLALPLLIIKLAMVNVLLLRPLVVLARVQAPLVEL